MTRKLHAIRLMVNGEERSSEVEATTTLQELLHTHLGRTEVKKGCGEGVCGSCTVLLAGAPCASCSMLAWQAHEREVVTAAGLPDAAALAEHLVAREAFQCGYCAPGFLVSATHLLRSQRRLARDEVRRGLSGHICRCTGYGPIVEAVVAASAGEAPPALGEDRADLRAKLFGTVQYPSDQLRSDALVGRILYSEHAAARVDRVDVRAALRVPGVVAVLTAQDIPGKNVGGTGLFSADQEVLASSNVRSFGDAVALVAAETEQAAREALAAIVVVYSPKPAVFDVLDAVQPDAPRVAGHGNVVAQLTKTKGDLEQAETEAEVVVEETYRTLPNDHVCMEREGGVGWLDGDTLVLSVTSLTPHVIRTSVARVLGLPESDVRIDTPRMGGSFGKYLMQGVESHLALLVHSTRRSVRLVLERGEIVARAAKRHPFTGRYRLGVKRDGTFVFLDAQVYADSGPYDGLTPTVISVFADEANGAYAFKHIRVVATGVRTNNLPGAPMRGFGSQQINFGIESIVEKAAHTLGMDPVALRAKNFVKTRIDPDAVEIADPDNALLETLTRAVAALGDRPTNLPPTLRIGRGLASVRAKYAYPYGMVDRFTARMVLSAGGKLRIECDIPDSGTGIPTGLARLAAAEIGLETPPEYGLSGKLLADPSGTLLAGSEHPTPFMRLLYRLVERAQILQTAQAMAATTRFDARVLSVILRVIAWPLNGVTRAIGTLKSRWFPYGVDSYIPRTSGSRGMAMAGRAVVAAAGAWKAKIVSAAAERLGIERDHVALDDRGAFDRRKKSTVVSWAALAEQGEVAALGSAALPAGKLLAKNGNQAGSIDHMLATHACWVAVDTTTGLVRVLKYAACQDVGVVHHPAIVKGQILGGIAMGIGQALSESMGMERGIPAVRSLHDYHVVGPMDMPEVHMELLESGTGLGPRGAKGVGEVGAVAAPIAVANAVYDAIGQQLCVITTTPEEVVRAGGRWLQEGGAN